MPRPLALTAAVLAVSLASAFGTRAQAQSLPAALPAVSVGDVVVREVNGVAVAASFPVSLSAPALTQVTVGYATRNGDALAPADFAQTTGSLSFAPGQTSQTVTVPVADDQFGETAERFGLILSNPFGASLARAVGAGTIVDDDAVAVRPAPRVTMTVTPTRRGSTLVRGRVLPPAGMLMTACSSSDVTVILSRGKRTVAERGGRLDDNCAYRVRLKRRAGRVRIVARFEGSDALRPANSRPASLRPY